MSKFRPVHPRSYVLIILAVCFLVSGALTQSSDQPPLQATSLEDLSWLAGKWRGEAFGGVFEEYWDLPWDGSMVGTFKVSVENRPSFYEFMSIVPDSVGLSLRVKHFNPDLSGWEHKDSSAVFRFIGQSESEVRFDGLTYRLLSSDSLRIIINLGHSEGQSREVTIDCQRIACPDSVAQP